MVLSNVKKLSFLGVFAISLRRKESKEKEKKRDEEKKKTS